MQITWINHASFLVAHGDIRLVCDPWLEGKAFAESWALLSKSAFILDDFENVTHIWISHEHPDHFSTDTLRRIDPGARSQITILFQRTRDGRVINYCNGLGFKNVVELPAGTWTSLAEGFDVMCQPEAFDDSWLGVRAGGITLLNLNDCFLNSDKDLERVKRQVAAPIDILLTQFSYASWAGNQGDRAMAAKAALEARERILRHTRHLEPRIVIPSASFVWFCHEENSHMNQEMNRINDIFQLLQNETNSRPLVLYPGDSWTLSSKDDPSPIALKRYVVDYESIALRERIAGVKVDLDVLTKQADHFKDSLFRFHGVLLRLWVLAGRLPRTSIWLKDHGRAVTFSLNGLLPLNAAYGDCDVALTSSALALLFANLWGGMTLIISGRFDVPSGGNVQVGGPPASFRRYVMLADDANHGWRMFDELLLRLKSRLFRRDIWPVRHTPTRDRPL